MDLKESFERALDGGPAHRPIEDRLIIGRRARRERHTATAIVATVIALGGVGWASLAGAVDTTDERVAASSSSTPTLATVSESPLPTVREPLYDYDFSTGELESAPGVTIQRRLDHPIDRRGVRSSAAVVTFEGETWWVMSAQRKGPAGRSGWSEEHEATSVRSFEQWVHEMDVLNTEPLFDTYGYEAGWVTIGEDGVLIPHKGATILEQSSPARLDQAPEGVPSATATIEVDGARLCVIARILDEPGPAIAYLAESEYPGCGDAVIGYPYESAP